MSSEDKPGLLSSVLSGIIVIPALTLALAPVFRIGLLDTPRTIYNFGYGDMPVLKQELVDYCRDGIRNRYQLRNQNEAEEMLKQIIGYNFEGPIDPNKVSIETLWDTQEDFAKSTWDRFFWADLR